MTPNIVQDFNDARNRGFSPTRAARWAAYRIAARDGRVRPITLDEAVRQVQEVKP